MANTPFSTRLSSGAAVAVLFGIVVAVNIIFHQIGGKLDLTSEKLHTTSPGTRHIVKNLEKDVVLKYYLSRSTPGIDARLKQYGKRIEDLLRAYSALGRGRITLEVYDPKPDSDEEEWARKYGLRPRPLSPLGGDEFFCGVVAVAVDGTEKALPFLTEQEDDKLEYNLTKLLHEVTQAKRPAIGVVSTLPVMGGPAMPPMMRQQQRPPQKWVFMTQLERLMEVRDLGTSFDRVPDDLQTLLVIQPKNLSPQTLYALDQFVVRGGRLIAFLDAMSLAEQQSNPQANQFAMFQSGSDLNSLTKAWGAEFDSTQVLADPPLAMMLSLGQGRAGRVPTVISLTPEQINRDIISTSGLDDLVMAMPGSFTNAPVAGIEYTELAHSTDQAGGVNPFQAMGDPDAMVRSMTPLGRRALAVQLKGKFPSSFPDGAPPAEPTAEGEPASPTLPAHITQGEKDGVVVLVGDTDMLADSWSVQVQNLFGNLIVQQLNDNINLVLNVAEQLGGSDALISLRSRGRFFRPLSRMEEMERLAREKYQIKIEQMESTLAETQQRLSALQSEKSADQLMILSPEQQTEIARYEEESMKVRRELRELRKEFNKDVERMQNRVRWTNTLAMPALVAVFGVVYGIRRRIKSGA